MITGLLLAGQAGLLTAALHGPPALTLGLSAAAALATTVLAITWERRLWNAPQTISTTLLQP